MSKEIDQTLWMLCFIMTKQLFSVHQVVFEQVSYEQDYCQLLRNNVLLDVIFMFLRIVFEVKDMWSLFAWVMNSLCGI